MKNKAMGKLAAERGPGRPTNESEIAEGHIHLRVTMGRKAAYVRAARPGKLSEWMTAELDRAAGYRAMT